MMQKLVITYEILGGEKVPSDNPAVADNYDQIKAQLHIDIEGKEVLARLVDVNVEDAGEEEGDDNG